MRRTSRVLSNLSQMGDPATGSSVARPVLVQDGDISRDISDLRQELVSLMLSFSSHQSATWKLLGVLVNRIDCIASNQESLLQEVLSLKKKIDDLPDPRVNWLPPPSLSPVLTEAEKAWFDGLIQIPDTGDFPDLSCNETLFPSNLQSTDQASTSGGSMVPPEWEKVAVRTSFSRRLS